MTKKVVSLSRIKKIVRNLKRRGRKIGLITGGFDIIHLGHVVLFRFAKKYVDVLVVGVENDENIKNAKGKGRPINSLAKRTNFLSEIVSVDYIFPIQKKYDFEKEGDEVLGEIVRRVGPTHLITHKRCDRYWKNKKVRAGKLGIKFLMDRSKMKDTSGKIIERIQSEL